LSRIARPRSWTTVFSEPGMPTQQTALQTGQWQRGHKGGLCGFSIAILPKNLENHSPAPVRQLSRAAHVRPSITGEDRPATPRLAMSWPQWEWRRWTNERTMDTRAEQLTRALDQLGDSAAQVAATLEAKGISGARNAVRILNPIVRFVAGALALGKLDMNVIDPNMFKINLPDGTCVAVPLPQAIRDFLAAFNRSEYPKLEMSIQLPPAEP
jgi:hypothetical protein